ncbi:MAG: DUF1329 domain-containing protein [Acidobacteria bacterium]|nr:DUF1329 domain-containing protein [Acidobacteriota bacterium]
MRRLCLVALAMLLAIGSITASRAPSVAEQAARLDADLTPVGAERAGNADGSIPAWTGGLPKAPPIDPKVGYVDPFADDKPLYTITAKNAAEYKDLLSAGHMTLLKRDARTFRMNVYPTRRSASYPEDVLAEVKKHAGTAKTDGYHVRDVGRSAVPFPIPENGLQVMWNHVFRWRGGSVERQYVWAPVDPSGKFYVVRFRMNVAYDQQGYMLDSREGRLYNATGFYLSPPAAIGIRAATWEPIDPVSDPRTRWVFLPQTLDTRRMPAYEYDTQEMLTGGLRLADQNDGWQGAPDRFSWKLIGKRELLIGYNGYRIADRTLRYPDIIRARNLDPDLLRYERHRVWVVEATRIKSHKFYRRVFYVDEDTWQVAQEEDYDKTGKLVRFGDYHMMQFYDVQVPWYAATINHDIGSGAYLVSYLNNMEPFPMRWGFKARINDYLPSRLRSLGLE